VYRASDGHFHHASQGASLPVSSLVVLTYPLQKCRLQISPPSLQFARQLRLSSPVEISFFPLSDPQQREILIPNGYIYLLTDLFLVCELMTSSEKIARGSEAEEDRWLLYPPLAGKHLRVRDGQREGELEVTVMGKETLALRMESGVKAREWKTAFEAAIAFGNNSQDSSLYSCWMILTGMRRTSPAESGIEDQHGRRWSRTTCTLRLARLGAPVCLPRSWSPLCRHSIRLVFRHPFAAQCVAEGLTARCPTSVCPRSDERSRWWRAVRRCERAMGRPTSSCRWRRLPTFHPPRRLVPPFHPSRPTRPPRLPRPPFERRYPRLWPPSRIFHLCRYRRSLPQRIQQLATEARRLRRGIWSKK
jgi:hypothetical protein